MTLRRIFSAGAVLLALATSAAADEVVLIPNSTVKGATNDRVRGTVQSESTAEVVVKLGNTTINIPTDQIVTINYASAPASLALAESNESSGQLAKAVDLYKKAAADASGKPFIEQTASFKQAELTADIALGDPGKAAEAVGLLQTFVKTYPTSRHVGAALEALARFQLAKGDFGAADKTIADLAKLPAGADRAAVLKAKVLARKGDNEAAVKELDRLIAGSPAGSVRQREAKLAKAESLAVLKQFKEAEADVRAVIQAVPPEDVAAQSAAYNTLGDCLRAAGKKKDALIAYLHTDVLYAKDKEQHARSLAGIVQLWRELKNDTRADEVLKQLRSEYPQSPWLAAATTLPTP